MKLSVWRQNGAMQRHTVHSWHTWSVIMVINKCRMRTYLSKILSWNRGSGFKKEFYVILGEKVLIKHVFITEICLILKQVTQTGFFSYQRAKMSGK